MGLMDSLKNALGGKSTATETVKSPSAVLRGAGIDPSKLDIQIRGDGSVRVSGFVDSEDKLQRITDLLSDIPQVTGVDNRLVVGAEPAPPPESSAEAAGAPTVAPPAPEPPAPVVAAATGETPTHTVQSGDTLWKIAQEHYGNGAKYTAIFEANRDVLDDPDRIFPGQVLKLPPLDD